MNTRDLRTLLLRAALASSVALPASALAQEAVKAGASTDLDAVVVTNMRETGLNLTTPASTASRLGLTPMQTPATVTVVTGELIRDRGDQTLLQAITRAPGFSMAPTVGNGNSFFTARGFYGATSVMYLYDGILLRLAANTAVFPSDPWNVERLEILSGPASVMYGSGAIGGAVNVITKKPDFNARHSEAEVYVGSYGTFNQALDITGPINDKLAYRFNISHRSSNGFVDRAGSHSLAYSAALKFQPNARLSFTLAQDSGRAHLSTYEGSVIANNQLVKGLERTNYNIDGAAIANKVQVSSLREEWQVSDSVSIRNYSYFTSIERPFKDATVYTYLPATQQVRISSFRNISNQYSYQYGDSGDLTWKTRLGDIGNEMTVGFDLNSAHYKRADNTSLAGAFTGAFTVSAFNYTPVPFSAGGQGPLQLRFLSKIRHEGFFAEDRVVLSEQVSVVGGVRHDHYKAENADIVVKTVARTDQSNTTFHVGLVYQPTSTLSLFTQYATGTDPFAGALSGLSLAQQAFKLSTGRSYEAGIKQTLLNGRFNWTVSAFRIIKKNVITPSADNPAVSVQAGQQSASGVEASASLALGKFAVGANAALTDPQFDEFRATIAGVFRSLEGFTPAFVPKKTANLWASWDFTRQWQVRSEVRYVGLRYADNTNLFPLPEYTVVGAGLRFAPTDRITLDARVDNLFDKTYAESANQAAATQWVLGQPRAYSIRANYKF